MLRSRTPRTKTSAAAPKRTAPVRASAMAPARKARVRPATGTPSLQSLLSEASRKATADLERVLRPKGVPVEYWRVLEVLADESGRPMTALADTVSMRLPTLSKLIDRMVQGLRRSQNELRAVMRGLLPVAVDSATAVDDPMPTVAHPQEQTFVANILASTLKSAKWSGRNPKQLLSIAAQDGYFVGIVQEGRIQNQVDGHRPGERNIGSEEDLAHPNFGHQVPKSFVREHHRIDEDFPLEIVPGRPPIGAVCVAANLAEPLSVTSGRPPGGHGLRQVSGRISLQGLFKTSAKARHRRIIRRESIVLRVLSHLPMEKEAAWLGSPSCSISGARTPGCSSRC